MAKLEDLIKQIPDPKLRADIAREAATLKATKKFGLVFEDHIPEQVQLPNLTVQTGARVVKRGNGKQVFQVLEIKGKTARLAPEPQGEEETEKVDELVVIKNFGEPIYPTLTPRERVERAPDKPWHTIINADNFHALQLLLYCYEGMVDVIYIDPPYNTGARDWKYNNDYVDSNDQWRHSKWLAFMSKRLKLAKKLLNPSNSILIVAIDDNELFALGMLLDDIFMDCTRQIIDITINPKGKARDGRLSQVDEYLIVIYVGTSEAKEHSSGSSNVEVRWPYLRRSDVESARGTKKGGVRQFYPIYVDENTKKIIKVGEHLTSDQPLSSARNIKEAIPVFPIREDGKHMNWGLTAPSLETAIQKGFVRVTKSQNEYQPYNFAYLTLPSIKKVENGDYLVIGTREDGSKIVAVPGVKTERGTTSWKKNLYDANAYGSQVLGSILPDKKFPFPKSIYAVFDTLQRFLSDKPVALVVDYFAGSGTTLHALNLLNATDGGQRRCILVTNNEVSDEEAKALTAKGYKQGDDEWEQQGICQAVTWPRSKYTIQGQRDDGTELEGEYFTGRIITKEKLRRFKHIGFLNAEHINTTAKKKQLVSLLKYFPQSLVTDDSAFIVSTEYSVSILFDDGQSDAWLEALEEQNHITDFYIVAGSKATFDAIKVQVTELLGPLTEIEEEKRPNRTGFEENLEYFRLDFLDPQDVAIGEKFESILPILWLIAGAQGKRENDKGEKGWFIPKNSPFAVLVDEHAFTQFKKAIAKRTDLTHIFLVTDSLEAYQKMIAQLPENVKTKMRYKSYLDNFKINIEGSI